ncbi:5'/3'-nucleotidase SurE [Solimonas terrae]|uniref:5'-nucleotidase n=1 Tax=Solimonas terrae TaxID=1396819 RepID=A0A6M2BSU3_9GAMM|nr:5'/3'-nucleotidase SurE [Solimonas terrae]NGY05702.1 acid phosphatase [Solimonas terrae]
MPGDSIRHPRASRWLAAAALLLGTTLSAPSWALNIVLSNDDGFESANIHALYAKLKAAGYDVVVSAPAQNNSGKGGAMNFLQPITPLTRDTRFGTVKAGAPGVGSEADDADIHYVDGTPVMALLYGLDVVAPQRWGGQPDLVISGPNEGGNLGMINPSSGTFNNAVYAVNRGIPAIAVSAASTNGRSYTALTDDASEYELADVVVRLVAQLDAGKGSDGRLLPPGVGLNVNVPNFAAGTASSLKFRFARMGLATDYQPVFYASLADSPNAVQYGAGAPYPGVSIVTRNVTPPSGVVLPDDTAASSEANVLADGAIPVTVFEGVPQARRSNEDPVRIRLQSLLDSAN